MLPRFQATLLMYEEEQTDEDDAVEKIPLETTGSEPADRVFGILVSLRKKIEDAHASDQMPDQDLPHTHHPPNLVPRQEMGYRLINCWRYNLGADERVDDAWLERSRECEKCREYDQYFNYEIITLHIRVDSFVIELTPDGVDRVVTRQDTIWSGELFMEDPATPFRVQLEDLTRSLSARN